MLFVYIYIHNVDIDTTAISTNFLRSHRFLWIHIYLILDQKLKIGKKCIQSEKERERTVNQYTIRNSIRVCALPVNL